MEFRLDIMQAVSTPHRVIIVRMLCMGTPAGLDAFFLAVGDRVDSRTAPPPRFTPEEISERQKRAGALLAKYRAEIAQA
jgi:hypothetical protein